MIACALLEADKSYDLEAGNAFFPAGRLLKIRSGIVVFAV
jgi:hypothetical protein